MGSTFSGRFRESDNQLNAAGMPATLPPDPIMPPASIRNVPRLRAGAIGSYTHFKRPLPARKVLKYQKSGMFTGESVLYL